MSRYHIRWMIRRDMPEVMAIENASHPTPLDESAMLTHLRQRNTIGMVAEFGEQIVGFMIYELHKAHLNVIRFAVAPDWRRQRVGTGMLEKLTGKLAPHRRPVLILAVHEALEIGHLFLRSQGVIAQGISYETEDDGADSYHFDYREAYAADPVTTQGRQFTRDITGTD
jgi:ribosomal-protein-alanine N-acetyltransferase